MTINLQDIDDPFSVPSVPVWWKGLPIFVLLLPVTMIFLTLGLLTGLIFIPIFPWLSMRWKDLTCSFCNKCLLMSLRIPVNVIVDDPSSLDGKLFVAPHTSLFEALVILANLGHYRPLAAEFTRHIPIFGHFIHALNPIYVHRGKGSGGLVNDLVLSLEEGTHRHLIFPEGTYTNGTRLIQFKSGAFVAGHPIVPVAIRFPKYVPYWNRLESSMGVQIYRVLSRWYTPATLHFLPTYHPSSEEKANPKLYAENVRQMLSTVTNLPLSKYELKDSPNYQKDTQSTPQN